MPAWTNIHPVKVGDVKVGSKTVFFNHTNFEVRKNTKHGTTILRCVEANPEAGYGEGSIIELDSETTVHYDINKEKKHN